MPEFFTLENDFQPFADLIGQREEAVKTELKNVEANQGGVSAASLVNLQYNFNFLQMMVDIGSSMTDTLKTIVGKIVQKF